VIKDKLLTYSVWWDHRPLFGLEPPYARAIMTALEQMDFRYLYLTCHFYFENGTTYDVPAKIHDVGDSLMIFALCPAKDVVNSVEDAPASVSFVCNDCESQWTYEVCVQ